MSRNSLEIEYATVASLRDNPRSPRRHSKKKIAQLAESIRKLGFNVPVIIGADTTIRSFDTRRRQSKVGPRRPINLVVTKKQTHVG